MAETCPAVKLPVINQCHTDSGQTKVLNLLGILWGLFWRGKAEFLPALTASGLLERDANRLHSFSCPASLAASLRSPHSLLPLPEA